MVYLFLTVFAAAFLRSILQQDFYWPEDWYPCLAAMGALSLLARLTWLRSFSIPSSGVSRRLSAGLLVALLVAAAVPLLPLPLAWVEGLAPAQGEALRVLGTMSGATGYGQLSVQPAFTLVWWLTLAACVMVFLTVRGLVGSGRASAWGAMAPILLVALLEAVLGIWQYYVPGGAQFGSGTYENRNHFAGLLEMCLPFAIAYGVYALRRERHRHSSPMAPAIIASAAFAAAAGMLVAILFSLSRMGFLAALASLILMGTAALGGNPRQRRKWIAVGGVAAMVAAAFILLPSDALIGRFAQIAATDDISGDTRAEIWRDSLRCVPDAPWFGSGLGGYETALYRHKTVGPMYTVDYAHNDYIQLLVEMGLAGFLPLLVLALITLGMAVKRSSIVPGDLEGHVALACTGSLAALAIHSLVDYNLYTPPNMMIAAWIGGVVHGLRD